MTGERLMSIDEFDKYLERQDVPRRIDEVIVHHTWKPTADQYAGKKTIAGIRNYHMNVRGWSDNGYHFMFGTNGDLWRCRPMQRAGAHTLGRNAHSVGISYVANFDSDKPEEYPGWQTGIDATALLLSQFGIGIENIRFHREFASKTCPGLNVHMQAYRDEVQAVLDGQQPQPDLRVIILPENAVIPCGPEVDEDGVTRCDLRTLAEILGYDVIDHISDQNKIYVREASE